MTESEIDLDQLGDDDGSEADSFEGWAAWPHSAGTLALWRYLPVSNLRNPPPRVTIIMPWEESESDVPAPFDLP